MYNIISYTWLQTFEVKSFCDFTDFVQNFIFVINFCKFQMFHDILNSDYNIIPYGRYTLVKN